MLFKKLAEAVNRSLLLRSLLFLVSSMLLCAVSLNFAIGIYPWRAYFGYFRHPSIFLFNWLPVLICQMVLLALTGRQWIAFLLNSFITFLPAIGNYYKLQFRNDPFVFSDITSIRAGLSVAKDYNLQFSDRILVSIIFVIIGTLCVFWLTRKKKTNPKCRIALILASLLSIWPLWRFVYSNDFLYYKTAGQNFVLLTRDDRDTYRAAGFPYPFLHSIKASAEIPPEGYDAKTTEQKLNAYSSESIPEYLRPNILVLQLESFSDFEEMGVDGIADFVYAPLRELQAETYSGNMLANVIGGGTINTERCVMSGSYKLLQYSHPAFSYVRYLRENGYFTTGSHPNVKSFYSRGVVNDYLGFEEYLYRDDYFSEITKWRCDSTYLPEVFRLFREHAASNTPVFSYNVTTQGHWPYAFQEYYDRSDYWECTDNVRPSTRYLLNNYFSLIYETEQVIVQELETLKDFPEPVIVLMFGDHKPWLADGGGLDVTNPGIYQDLGLSFDLDTEEGLLQYLDTPYMIWANDAAKEMTGNDFTGDGPTISPGYLMNVLFQSIGWSGPAYMQYTSNIMETLPLIYTNGRYIENGIYTAALSPEGTELLQEYDNLQFYAHYRPELAEQLP